METLKHLIKKVEDDRLAPSGDARPKKPGEPAVVDASRENQVSDSQSLGLIERL